MYPNTVLKSNFMSEESPLTIPEHKAAVVCSMIEFFDVDSPFFKDMKQHRQFDPQHIDSMRVLKECIQKAITKSRPDFDIYKPDGIINYVRRFVNHFDPEEIATLDLMDDYAVYLY